MAPPPPAVRPHGGPRTGDGRYSFDIDARVSENEVAGAFTNAQREGGGIDGSGLSGSARGLDEPDEERLCILSLPRAIEARGGDNGLLRVHLRYADGRITDGVAMCPRFPQWFDVDADQLQMADGQIEGTLAVHFNPDSPVITSPHRVSVDYRIRARIGEDGGISGDYECTFGTSHRRRGPPRPAR